MLFFKNKMAVPNVRKLNRKIKKINKIRTHYLDYCDIITNDANNFTETMMKVHDEMIDAIKVSREVEKNFDEVYTKYADLDNESDDEEEDEDEDDPNSIDFGKFFDIDEEEDDDDDEDSDNNSEDNSDGHKCGCGCHHENEEADDEKEKCKCNHSEPNVKIKDCKEIDLSKYEMRNFKRENKDIILNTTMAMSPASFNQVDKLDELFTKYNFEKVCDSVADGVNETAYEKKNVSVDIKHLDGEIFSCEMVFPLMVIPHNNPCNKIYSDITVDGEFIPIIKGTKPVVESNSTNISTWYICNCGRGNDIEKDDVLLVNIDVDNKMKNTTIRYIRSSFIDDETKNAIIKK